MPWTVRYVFKKPSGDPLYEYFSNITHENATTFKKEGLVSITFYRNLDRSIGLIFFTYQSKEIFDQWLLENMQENEDIASNAASFARERGITILRQLPDSENQNWADPMYNIDGVIGYDRVTVEQIMAGE